MGKAFYSRLYWYKSHKLFWFRLFGYGLCFSKRMKFSQRIGKSKYLKLFGWIIEPLKPVKS